MAVKGGNDQLRDLVQDLGKVPNEVRKRIRPVLRRSAQKPLAEARRNASWSSRIPGATRISVGFSKRTPGVALVVNRHKAPHARAYENGGKNGTFRSPVFGNRKKWVNHTARPFLFKVARPWADQVSTDVGEVVDKVARDLGFRK